MNPALNKCCAILLVGYCATCFGIAFVQAQTLDTMLKLGFLNTADEAAHNVSVSTGVLTGGSFTLGQSSRVVAPSQDIYFDIAVDPVEQNYITTRFFSDRLSSAIDVPGRTLIGTDTGANIDWGQLDDSTSAGMLNDHWHYATIPLPLSMTSGQSTVRLSLNALEHHTNWQEAPVNPVENTANSRPIYGVFSHTNPRFEVPDAVQNNPVVAPYDYGGFTKLTPTEVANYVSTLTSIADGVVASVLPQQTIDTTGLPDSVLGTFSLNDQGSHDATLDATHVRASPENYGRMKGSAILAYGYTMPGGAYENDPNVLQRVAWGLDYCRRAQGNTGGYHDVHGPITWLGGGTAANPDRVLNEGTGSLEGTSHQEVAKAFLLTHSAMESAGLLDVLIDDDNKPATPMVPRRQAYEDMFREFVDFHTGYFEGGANDPFNPVERGHAPNQDLFQVGALRYAMEALEILNPTAFHLVPNPNPVTSHAIAQAELKSRAFESAGITLTPVYNSYWTSPTGLPLEGGGFDSAYGRWQSEMMWEILEYVDDPNDRQVLIDRAADQAALWQNFWYPIYNSQGAFDMRVPGGPNWRVSAVGGIQTLLPASFAGIIANGVEDPDVIRMLQLAYMDGQLHKSAQASGHFWGDGIEIMEQVALLGTLMADLPSTSDLPMESQRLVGEMGQGDFTWVDPVGGMLAFRHDDAFIYMTTNWKSGRVAVVNDIVRIQEITFEEGRVVTAMMENPTGNVGELYRVEYGDYLIGMNADDVSSFTLSVPTADGFVPDLVSGDLLEIVGGQLQLTAGESVILLLDEFTTGIDDADFDGNGFVNGVDFLILQQNFGVVGGTLYGPGDANGDGNVDQLDIDIWQTQYGTSPITDKASTVPEPSSLVLWGLACLMPGRRNRLK